MTDTILIVDEDGLIVELLTEALGDEGYAVQECSTLQHAQLLLQTAIPDLLVLDVRFPDTANSVAFIEALRLRRATCALTVIVYSADWFCLKKQAAQLTVLGCVVVSKPFALDSFLTLIAHRLGATPDQTATRSTTWAVGECSACSI